jgi:hypothetical protein
VEVPAAPLSPQLDPEQVKQQLHLMAHADRKMPSSVFIKGNHFVATPSRAPSETGSPEGAVSAPDSYRYVLSVDSVSYQGVIYRVRCHLLRAAVSHVM